VNLTPPWQAAGDTPVIGTGGGGGSGGNRDDSGASGGSAGDVPLPGPTDAEDDANQQAPDAPADVSDIDGINADARLDGSDSSALDALEAGSDRPALGGSGGSVSKGGAGGSGGVISHGGSGGGGTATGGASSGGQVGSGGTGGSGTGGAPAIDAGSVCVGRPGSDASTGINAGLVAYYPCDQTSGPTLTDQSGNNDGTLTTGTGGTPGYSFGAGKVGTGALDLVAAGHGYATLPSGLLDNTCDVTIATWVYINTSANWQRVFDFGKDTNVYMFLAAKNAATNFVRFAISVSGNGSGEQMVDGTSALSVNAWSHVAIVLGTSGATLYVGGNAVGTNANITLRPADLGTPLNYYIGRSQFSVDPYLDGNIDDFRIYGRALSASEIQALAQM
jgi:hypothetical protein